MSHFGASRRPQQESDRKIFLDKAERMCFRWGNDVALVGHERDITMRKLKTGKRAAAAAMVDLGVPMRTVAAELGISKTSVLRTVHDPTLDPDRVNRVKERLADRYVLAADSLLSHSWDRIKKLDPYRAMICSGIAHDHYLKASGKLSSAGLLTNILVLIDQSTHTTPGNGEPR